MGVFVFTYMQFYQRSTLLHRANNLLDVAVHLTCIAQLNVEMTGCHCGMVAIIRPIIIELTIRSYGSVFMSLHCALCKAVGTDDLPLDTTIPCCQRTLVFCRTISPSRPTVHAPYCHSLSCSVISVSDGCSAHMPQTCSLCGNRCQIEATYETKF